jgi:soluble lytic murein transglycosylase-like protein
MNLLGCSSLFILIAYPPLLLSAVTAEQLDISLRQQLIASVGIKGGFKDRFHAQAWLMDMEYRLKTRVHDLEERLAILSLVHREAIRANLPPALILAVIEVESNFDRFAISEAGAQGLMQVMPFWLKEMGDDNDNLFDISTNLSFGCAILRHYLDREKGNLTRALARYNGSTEKVWYPNRIYKALHRWQ